MLSNFTLEYWMDDDWYVGKLKEIPGIFSQGETLEEMEENIQDAYNMILQEEQSESHPGMKEKNISVEVM